MQDNSDFNGNDNKSDKSGNRPPDNSNNKKILFGVLAFALISTFLMNILMTSFSGSNMFEIEYSDFMTLVDRGAVKNVRIESDRLIIDADISKIELPEGMSKIKQVGEVTFYTGLVGDTELIQNLKDHVVKFS